MKCSFCGGPVTWRGPLSNLTHTECATCGRQNCQEVESFDPERLEPDNHEYDELGLPPDDGVAGTPGDKP
jgi:hypothetical protein